MGNKKLKLEKSKITKLTSSQKHDIKGGTGDISITITEGPVKDIDNCYLWSRIRL